MLSLIHCGFVAKIILVAIKIYDPELTGQILSSSSAVCVKQLLKAGSEVEV